MNNIKMTDIAKASGVSLATVGRAIHGGYISEDKRLKIEKAIEDLGYVPNKIARGLKSSESKMIGHLVTFNPNMLYAKISTGVNNAAQSLGYSVFTLTGYREKDEDLLLIDEFISRKVDGIIITSNENIGEDCLKKLKKLNIPTVMVERALNTVDRVLVDDVDGAYNAVANMIKNGRRKVAYIGRKTYGDSVEEDRKTGYLTAVSQSASNQNNPYIAEVDEYSAEGGYTGAKMLIESGIKPDGVFCASDIIAAGAMQYFYEKGILIPKDISVVGYDDTISTMLSPQISSVALNTEEIGKAAMDMIVKRIAEPEKEIQIITTKTIYIERNS